VPRRNGPAAAASAAGPGIKDVEQRHPDTTPHSGAPAAHAEALRLLRRQRAVRRLHRLGPRVLFELLDEIGRHHGIGPDIDRRITRYAAADPAVLAAVGGDRFPMPTLRLVGGER
jgi:hypothetical protein